MSPPMVLHHRFVPKSFCLDLLGWSIIFFGCHVFSFRWDSVTVDFEEKSRIGTCSKTKSNKKASTIRPGRIMTAVWQNILVGWAWQQGGIGRQQFSIKQLRQEQPKESQFPFLWSWESRKEWFFWDAWCQDICNPCYHHYPMVCCIIDSSCHVFIVLNIMIIC